jgi:hypothetical protein
MMFHQPCDMSLLCCVHHTQNKGVVESSIQRYKHKKFGVGGPVLKEVTECNGVNVMAESPNQEMVLEAATRMGRWRLSKDQWQVKNVHLVCKHHAITFA